MYAYAAISCGGVCGRMRCNTVRVNARKLLPDADKSCRTHINDLWSCDRMRRPELLSHCQRFVVIEDWPPALPVIITTLQPVRQIIVTLSLLHYPGPATSFPAPCPTFPSFYALLFFFCTQPHNHTAIAQPLNMPGRLLTLFSGPTAQKRGREDDAEVMVEPVVLARIRDEPTQPAESHTAIYE